MTSSKSAEYELSVILSVIHNRLFCDFDTYRSLLEHATGHDINLWNVAPARVALAKYFAKEIPPSVSSPRPPDKNDTGSSNKFVKSVAKAWGTDRISIRSGVVSYRPRSFTKAYFS